MTNQEYKRAFALLTEKLGRVPTPRDKEWLELTERLRKSYLPAEEEKWTSTPTTTTNTRAEAALPATSSVDSQTKSATGTEVSASTTDSATCATSESQSRPSSHTYAQATRTTTNARKGTDQPLSGPGIIPNPDPDRTTPDASSSPSRIDEGAMVGARGPSGGIYAKCDGCGRVWERERKRGRPARMCGECK